MSFLRDSFNHYSILSVHAEEPAVKRTVKGVLLTHRWSIPVALICSLIVTNFGASAYADDQRSPDQVVDSVAKQLLSELSAHRDQYRNDPVKLHALIDKYLLPNFDTDYAAKLVLATHWRAATNDQRAKFIKAFYHSLVSTYGNAIVDFTGQSLQVFPYKGLASDTTATVRSEVRRDNGQTVPVNYSLHKTAAGWKAWDVTIEGVSYVHSFRTDFGDEIKKNGLDELIARLEKQ